MSTNEKAAAPTPKLVRVKLAKAHSHKNRTYAAGAVIEVEEYQADLLEQWQVGARTTENAGTITAAPHTAAPQAGTSAPKGGN